MLRPHAEVAEPGNAHGLRGAGRRIQERELLRLGEQHGVAVLVRVLGDDHGVVEHDEPDRVARALIVAGLLGRRVGLTARTVGPLHEAQLGHHLLVESLQQALAQREHADRADDHAHQREQRDERDDEAPLQRPALDHLRRPAS